MRRKRGKAQYCKEDSAEVGLPGLAQWLALSLAITASPISEVGNRRSALRPHEVGRAEPVGQDCLDRLLNTGRLVALVKAVSESHRETQDAGNGIGLALPRNVWSRNRAPVRRAPWGGRFPSEPTNDAEGSIPSEPVSIAARSDKRSPNRLSVTMTSNCLGQRVNCIAPASAYMWLSSTSEYSAA